MTLMETLIHYQFLFEYGIGKFAVYLNIVNLGLILITLFTVKGISFPIWGIVPIAIALVIACTAFGYYLQEYKVIEKLFGHTNKNNKEFNDLVDAVARIEKKIDTLEKK